MKKLWIKGVIKKVLYIAFYVLGGKISKYDGTAQSKLAFSTKKIFPIAWLGHEFRWSDDEMSDDVAPSELIHLHYKRWRGYRLDLYFLTGHVWRTSNECRSRRI